MNNHAIEPEIIPTNSNDGYKALSLKNNWIIYILLVSFIIIFILLVRLLIESFLISLGLMFIWQQATK